MRQPLLRATNAAAVHNNAPVVLSARRSTPLITRRRVVISIILSLAGVLLVYGFSSARETSTKVTYTDAAVEDTFPKPGDLDLRQMRIGIDLKSGYTTELLIEGTPIPDDQVEKVTGLDQYFFTPGPGTATGALDPGRRCATALIRRIGEPPGTGRKFVWCFQVH